MAAPGALIGAPARRPGMGLARRRPTERPRPCGVPPPRPTLVRKGHLALPRPESRKVRWRRSAWLPYPRPSPPCRTARGEAGDGTALRTCRRDAVEGASGPGTPAATSRRLPGGTARRLPRLAAGRRGPAWCGSGVCEPPLDGQVGFACSYRDHGCVRRGLTLPPSAGCDGPEAAASREAALEPESTARHFAWPRVALPHSTLVGPARPRWRKSSPPSQLRRRAPARPRRPRPVQGPPTGPPSGASITRWTFVWA